MRVVILASFPVHYLPGFESNNLNQHHSTWLPQFSHNLEKVLTQNDDIHWIVTCKTVSEEVTIVHKKQTFHLLPRKNHGKSILTLFALERLRFRKILKNISPDIVHAWGSEDVYGFVQADWGGVSILSMQGILSYLNKVSPVSWLAKVTAWSEKYLIRKSSYVTVESRWGRDRINELVPNKNVSIIEYGVAKDFYEVERRPLDIPNFMFVGRLCHSKGIDILAKAFSDKRLAHINLTVVGDGPMKSLFTNKMPNVQLLGRKNRSEIAALLALTWGLVHPTRADTSPNCVKEARVSGVPVITTHEGGQIEYVEEGYNGYLVDVNSVDQLIKKILSIANSRKKMKDMGSYQLSHYREILQPQLTARNFYNLYKRCFASIIK